MNDYKPIIDTIFVDVDYTIYNTAKREFVLSSIEALNLAHKNGKKVIIVSSKSEPTLKEIGLFDVLPFVSEDFICTKIGYGKVCGRTYSQPINKEILLKEREGTNTSYIEELDKIAKEHPRTFFQFVTFIKTLGEMKKILFTYSPDKNSASNRAARKYEEEWNDKIGQPIDRFCANYSGIKDSMPAFFKNDDFDIHAIMVFVDGEEQDEYRAEKEAIKVTESISELMKETSLIVEPFGTMINITGCESTQKEHWVRTIIEDNNLDEHNCIGIGDEKSDFDISKRTNNQFIAIKSDKSSTAHNAALASLTRLETGFIRSVDLEGGENTIYSVLNELNVFKPEPYNGSLAKDINDEYKYIERLGIVRCRKSNEKVIDSWTYGDDVYFLGINGFSKVEGEKESEESNYYKLKRQITKGEDNQRINIFLLDPRSEQFSKHIEGLTNHDTLESYRESYKRWLELADEGSEHLILRFYNEPLPCFIKAVKNQEVSIANYSDDPKSVESFSKKEPSLIISHERTLEDGSRGENSLFTNFLTFFENKFNSDDAVKYIPDDKTSIIETLNRKIDERESRIKPIIFCYSSKNNVREIKEIGDEIKNWGCSPIEFKEYNYTDNWKIFLEKTMPRCSCVVFFIGENVFEIEDDNVLEELVIFFKVRKKLLARNKKYILVSMINNGTLEKKFDIKIGTLENNLKKLETNNKNRESAKEIAELKLKIKALKFYRREVKKGKIYINFDSSFYNNFKDLLCRKHGGLKPAKNFRLPEKKFTRKKNSGMDSGTQSKSSLLANLLRIGIRRCSSGSGNDQFKVLESDPNVSNNIKISSITEFDLSLPGEKHERFIQFLDNRLAQSEEGRRGKIKVLIIDPNNVAFKNIILNSYDPQKDEEGTLACSHRTALKQWIELANNSKYKEILDVRCNANGPQLFKMYCCEKTNMHIQPYDNTVEGQKNAKNRYPWLLIERGKPENSLFAVFNKLFDDLYEGANPITNYTKEDIDNIIDNYVSIARSSNKEL